MSFVVNVEETEFTRTDLAPYRAAFNELKPGATGVIEVPTGEIETDGPSKGKGKIALKHERRFRDVARERGVGLNVSHTVLGATTRLRLGIDKKREFTPEQIAYRTQKAAETRLKNAVIKKLQEKPSLTKEAALKEVKAEMLARKKEREAAAAKRKAS